MKKLSFIILAVLLLANNYKTLAQVTQQERDALIALYNATGGESWTHNDNWNVNAGAEEVTSDWYGITVEGGHVTYLYLQSNNLNGAIPPEIGNLSWLVRFYAYSNNLTGTIPPEIGSMTTLDYLRLENNQLTGQIPTQIEGLINLRVLQLSNNNLSGEIPVEFYNLTTLTGVQMYNNSLTGSISPLIGNLTNLRSLYLYSNQLSGNIPSEIGNLTLLNYLFLNGNQLSGVIPEQIGNLTNLLSLSLQKNLLTGTLPASIGSLNKLSLFLAGYNLLEGEIPASIFNLTTVTNLQLNDNQFSGGISANIAGMVDLQYLYLNGNQFSGDFPLIDGLNSLISLRLNSNQFVNLPDLSGLTSLSILNVEHNYLTFEDIQPNLVISGITYAPQEKVGKAQSQEVVTGVSHTLSITVGGTGNTYQWYKGGQVINEANATDYTISSFAEADAGVYYCQIDNPLVSMTLESESITLIMVTAQHDSMKINLPGIEDGSTCSLSGFSSGTLVSSDGSFNFLPDNIPATGILTIEDPSGKITKIRFDVDENGNVSNVQMEVDGQYIPMYQDFFTTSENGLEIVHIEDVCVYGK